MNSQKLPNIDEAKDRYEISFDSYAVLIYHPVTTEIDSLHQNIKKIVNAIIASDQNYIVIYPNNDIGSEIILNEYKRFNNNARFKIFPSIRFEFFLTLLKHSNFIIGNSSAGIREASVYGIPSIDIGNRQQGRIDKCLNDSVINVSDDESEIITSIDNVKNRTNTKPISLFGDGQSDEKFIKILESTEIWENKFQKKFVDIK